MNSLGVINRMNIAQMYEQELNFIADDIQRRMAELSKLGDWEGAWRHHQRFLQTVAPEQARWMEDALSPGSDERHGYLEEVCSGEEPIYIHQAPVFGNCGLDGLKEVYRLFGVEKVKLVGVEEPIILGTNYYMKLRHEPSGKFSARSAKHLSVAGVPTKNSKGVRSGTEHHSTTAVRTGEQELQNLLIANEPDELKRMLRIYATDDVSREGAILELLSCKDPFSGERIEPVGTGVTRPVAGFQALLESIGLRLEATQTTNEEGVVNHGEK